MFTDLQRAFKSNKEVNSQLNRRLSISSSVDEMMHELVNSKWLFIFSCSFVHLQEMELLLCNFEHRRVCWFALKEEDVLLLWPLHTFCIYIIIISSYGWGREKNCIKEWRNNAKIQLKKRNDLKNRIIGKKKLNTYINVHWNTHTYAYCSIVFIKLSLYVIFDKQLTIFGCQINLQTAKR